MSLRTKSCGETFLGSAITLTVYVYAEQHMFLLRTDGLHTYFGERIDAVDTGSNLVDLIINLKQYIVTTKTLQLKRNE